MDSLNQTPRGERVHISFFGKVNAGKSSLINYIAEQSVSIVSDVEGTTTDPVLKSMEILPIGPCVLIDTAGLGDTTELGYSRLDKTNKILEKTDMAVIVIAAQDRFDLACDEYKLYEKLVLNKTPVLFVVNKADKSKDSANRLASDIRNLTDKEAVLASTISGDYRKEILSAITRLMPPEFGVESITGNLVNNGDTVMLVMPQDIQAPKGRLILPQVQTIRDLLDKKCVVISVTTDEFEDALGRLKEAPKLIITDSQIFDFVYNNKPDESKLTSFSVLFAAYKGDVSYYIEGAKHLDFLKKDAKILIAECCSHAPLSEDIGREKIPAMLRKRLGDGISIDVISGNDFPKDLSRYNLIIQCGACMYNKKYVKSRINQAKEQNVKMTNYGMFIAYIHGILDRIAIPE